MFHLEDRAASFRLLLIAASLLVLVSCSSTGEGSLSAEGDEPPALRTVKLLPPAGSDYSRFGHAVATDGETVVVGAWGEADEAGAVYVYERAPEGWTRTALLTAKDAARGARFGYAVDVDGSSIAVGAIYESSRGHDAGATYIFERRESVWEQTTKLTAGGAAEYSHFGRSVALDGTRLVVGAPGPGSDAVHTFARTSQGWQPEALLASPAGTSGIRFGTSVALEGDTLAVGGWTELVEAAGFVVLYEQTGSTWAEAHRLTSSQAGDRFGYSLSLDGELLAVGAPDAPSGSMLHLYRAGTYGWTEIEPAIPSEHSPELGHAVALHRGQLLAGDPAFDGHADHAGQVLLAPAGDGDPASLLPHDLAEGSSFGISLAAGGDVIVVGAIGDKTRGYAAGAAYIYYR